MPRKPEQFLELVEDIENLPEDMENELSCGDEEVEENA